MDEHKLLSHINLRDSTNLVKLYIGNYRFGEVKKILYRHLYHAVSNGMEQVKVTTDRIEFYKDGSSQGYTDIVPFQSLTNTTFVEQFRQILDVDQVLVQSIDLIEQNEDSITIEIRW